MNVFKGLYFFTFFFNISFTCSFTLVVTGYFHKGENTFSMTILKGEKNKSKGEKIKPKVKKINQKVKIN